MTHRVKTSFVELCAGTAAVSFALVGSKPPVPYMGNKRSYAKVIIDRLGLDRVDRMVWVEPGEWSHTLRTILVDGKAEAVAEVLEFTWADHDDRELFDRLRTTAASSDPVERAAAHVYMSARTYRGKPVYPVDGGWRTHGFDPEYRQPKNPGPNTHARGWSNPRPKLAEKVRQIAQLPWPSLDIITARGEDIDPFPATVYIDPPYAKATAYPHKFDRSGALALARRWAEVGATVGVSEAEPLLDLGSSWQADQLPDRRRSRAFGAHLEWLTVHRGKTDD